MQPHLVAARAEQIRAAVAAASAEATSDDHAVTVVVGPGGAVRELHLSSRAFRHTGAELGAVVVRTIRDAHLSLQRELAETLAGLTGGAARAPLAPLPSPAWLRAELDRDGGAAR